MLTAWDQSSHHTHTVRTQQYRNCRAIHGPTHSRARMQLSGAQGFGFSIRGVDQGWELQPGSLSEGGGKLENAYAECRRMEKKQFSHLVAPQPLPKRHQGKPQGGCARLGLWLCEHRDCCSPLLDASGHCDGNQVAAHCYMSMKSGWITCLKKLHTWKEVMHLLAQQRSSLNLLRQSRQNSQSSTESRDVIHYTDYTD